MTTRPSANPTPDQPGASLSLERLRADVAAILHEDPSEIGNDDNLIDLGLDSIRAMALVTRWREAGADVEFSELAERAELAHWWQLCFIANKHQTAIAPLVHKVYKVVKQPPATERCFRKTFIRYHRGLINHEESVGIQIVIQIELPAIS